MLCVWKRKTNIRTLEDRATYGERKRERKTERGKKGGRGRERLRPLKKRNGYAHMQLELVRWLYYSYSIS